MRIFIERTLASTDYVDIFVHMRSVSIKLNEGVVVKLPLRIVAIFLCGPFEHAVLHIVLNLSPIDGVSLHRKLKEKKFVELDSLHRCESPFRIIADR